VITPNISRNRHIISIYCPNNYFNKIWILSQHHTEIFSDYTLNGASLRKPKFRRYRHVGIIYDAGGGRCGDLQWHAVHTEFHRTRYIYKFSIDDYNWIRGQKDRQITRSSVFIPFRTIIMKTTVEV